MAEHLIDPTDESIIAAAQRRLLDQRAELARMEAATSFGLDLPLPPGVRREPGPIRFFCAGFCGVEVPARGAYCAPCAGRQNREMRAMYLAEAYESISPGGSHSWCRHGNEQYAKRGVAKAVAVANRLPPVAKTRALQFLTEGYWRRERGNLLVIGPARLGKTHAVIALGNRILDLALAGGLPPDAFAAARGLRLVTGLDLARAKMQSKLSDEPPLVRMAKAASVLILDEIGYEDDRNDPHVVRDLIYDRYRAAGRKPTIVTSGCTLAELKGRYGAACIERLTDMGELIDLHGVSS